MTEWVKEDNWGAVKKGDRVRVERDDACAEFVVDEVTHSGRWVAGMGKYFLAAEGWTLYVPARPEPALPTEPGVYEAAAYPIARGYAPYIIEYGVLRESGTTVTVNATEAAEIGPFTRLEPVPITAKKVLDALIEEFGADPKNSYIAECAGRVAAEFGVTTDD